MLWRKLGIPWDAAPTQGELPWHIHRATTSLLREELTAGTPDEWTEPEFPENWDDAAKESTGPVIPGYLLRQTT